MERIVVSIQEVRDIVNELRLGASAQVEGMNAVGGAVSKLDSMTQQNSALVEQSAAAAQGLRDQAQRLKETVDSFKV